MRIRTTGVTRSFGYRFHLKGGLQARDIIFHHLFKEIHQHFNYDSKYDVEIMKEIMGNRNNITILHSTDGGQLRFQWEQDPGDWYTILIVYTAWNKFISVEEILSTPIPFLRIPNE